MIVRNVTRVNRDPTTKSNYSGDCDWYPTVYCFVQITVFFVRWIISTFLVI